MTWNTAKVTMTRAIREIHHVEYDLEDYLIWLDGAEPDDDSLVEYLGASRDWEEKFTDDSLISAEPWDADLDEAEDISTSADRGTE